MVKNVLNTLRKKQKNNKGFSLVELIVVIAIMAVLVGVLAPQFIKYVERSRQSTDLQNVEELKNAVEVAVADDGISTDATGKPIDIKIEITKTGDKYKAAINLGGAKYDSLTDSLTKTSVDLKSTGWGTMTFTYIAKDLKWDVGKNDVTYNSNKPERNMADVFSLDGKKTSTTP